MAKKQAEEVPAQLEVMEAPKRYSIRFGVKIPSRVEQYRMLEANVTVTTNNPDEALEEAREQFVKAVVLVCNTMGGGPT